MIDGSFVLMGFFAKAKIQKMNKAQGPKTKSCLRKITQNLRFRQNLLTWLKT